MFSPDGAFINTSKILSDAEAQFIYNGVEDEVAKENIDAGRVGNSKDDPKFAEAKAYADPEVSKQLPAAILQADVEARAGQGDHSGDRAADRGYEVDNEQQANDDGRHAEVKGVQAHEGNARADEEEVQADDGGVQTDNEEIQSQYGGLNVESAITSRGTENTADALDDSEASAALELKRYREFVLSKLLLSDKDQNQVRGLLNKYGWPTVWQSLDSIVGCGDGPTWTWQDVDNDLLVRLGDEKLLKMDKIAEYMFIGMRVSQCRDQYNALTTE
ncbi:hypothetical protein J4E81_004271 [Alternaria sp. BMP 2799]|nr:hypothetical protein J4E81_004271 [Alternaria sp. BMP 2799]